MQSVLVALSTHLPILMVHEEISCTLILQVGDLQAVSVTNFLWLENCIQILHGDDSFGNLRLCWVEWGEGNKMNFALILETILD